MTPVFVLTYLILFTNNVQNAERLTCGKYVYMTRDSQRVGLNVRSVLKMFDLFVTRGGPKVPPGPVGALWGAGWGPCGVPVGSLWGPCGVMDGFSLSEGTVCNINPL